MKIRTFAQQYKYFLDIIKLLSWVGNYTLTYQAAAWLAKKYNPYHFQVAQLTQNMCKGLKLSTVDSNKYSMSYLEQQGVFCLNAFFFKRMTLKWVNQHISIKNNLILENLLNENQGTLFLSYHHHFQHLMVSILGLYDKNPSFVAMSPESSPVYNELKFYIDYLHQHTECHFGRGKYIFIDPNKAKKTVREKIYQSLEQKGFIFSLHDNLIQPNKKTQNILFLGKEITVSVGTIEIALEMGKPIYCGLLEWKKGNHFELDLIPLNGSVSDVIEGYFAFLEQKVKQNPAIWEGWQWFQDCKEL